MKFCEQTGKVKFGRLGALFALCRIQRQDTPGHNEKRSYWCKFCKQYHLTSQPLKTRGK